MLHPQRPTLALNLRMLTQYVGTDGRYAGLLGLSVTYALGITNELGWMVRQSTEAEANMNSIERIDAYSKLAPEAGSHVSSDKRVPSSWPTHGRIIFHELYLRYRPSTPLVLRGLSLTIEGGEKVGSRTRSLKTLDPKASETNKGMRKTRVRDLDEGLRPQLWCMRCVLRCARCVDMRFKWCMRCVLSTHMAHCVYVCT